MRRRDEAFAWDHDLKRQAKIDKIHLVVGGIGGTLIILAIALGAAS